MASSEIRLAGVRANVPGGCRIRISPSIPVGVAGEGRVAAEKGVLSLDFGTIYENNTNPITGSSAGPNTEHESSILRTTLLSARYSVTPRFAWMLSVPYRNISAPKE